MNAKPTQQIVLIDSFIVPKESADAFLEKMHLSESILKTLPGFVDGYVYVEKGDGSRYNVITTATWENESAVASAKQAVAAAYRKNNFNPQAIMQELNIQAVRALYSRKPY
jgi:heme-degrading monooxygenase HmoA